MNLLYLPCHSILEYDELRMFSEIPGITIISPGAYWEPELGSELRPPLDFKFPREWMDKWSAIKPTKKLPDRKYHITPESIEHIDVIIVVNEWDWIFKNWEAIKTKKIIWRDIGQVLPQHEETAIKEAKRLGVKIVRYWDGYQTRKGYAGHDAIIPFAKYKSDFPEWTGGHRAVAGVCQAILQRREPCRFDCWEASTKGFTRNMFGPGNEDLDYSYKVPDYNELMDILAEHNAMWYGGTRPAPYTLGLMEAMFIGIPIFTRHHRGWEIATSEILNNNQIAHSTNELRDMIHTAINSTDATKEISRYQREYAHKHWDVSVVKPQWERLFKSL